jgi:hypothetical protein
MLVAFLVLGHDLSPIEYNNTYNGRFLSEKKRAAGSRHSIDPIDAVFHLPLLLFGGARETLSSTDALTVLACPAVRVRPPQPPQRATTKREEDSVSAKNSHMMNLGHLIKNKRQKLEFDPTSAADTLK